jgi:hypothetical protein
MIQPIDTTSEAWRAICETRSWLRQGYTSPEKVAELMAAVSAKRGAAAAVVLREEMRRQWRYRREWMGAVR